MKPKILGIAGSIRSARRKHGNQKLICDLLRCKTEDELKKYLMNEAKIQLYNYFTAGRTAGLPFDQIYANLRKLKGNKGLSNSEIALAAGLWAVAQTGCEINRVSLTEYFSPTGKARHTEDLKKHLLDADGILIATPVYFGDRGSLVESLIDFILNDRELHKNMQNKVHAGITVGAKRNGGQETALIYLLLDMLNVGLIAVGNDSDTTSQYGGTGHAGDVGTMAGDDYGLWTSMGTGRRIAHMAALTKLGRTSTLRGKVRIMFLVLQDRHKRALNYVRELVDQFDTIIEPTVIDVTEGHITRCLACDICPTRIDIDEEYRCLVRNGFRDEMGMLHRDLLNHDAIVPVVYSASDRRGLRSNYQRFVERTRYLRRGDYVFSDCLVAPLVLEDLGAHQNMQIRMITSLIRHHTVMTAPMIGYLDNGEILNSEQVLAKFSLFLQQVQMVTAGRLSMFINGQHPGISKYNPVGYILSAKKDMEDKKLPLRSKTVKERYARLEADAELRLLGKGRARDRKLKWSEKEVAVV